MAQPWLIGIGGTNASGKDTLAHYLVEKHNYMFVSTSDIIREVAMEQEGNILRPTLFKIGNDLRAEFGAGVLVARCIEKYEAQKVKFAGLVVSSIRTKGEIELLKEKGGTLIFTDADPKVRYNRSNTRQRLDDSITFEEFLVQQQVEWHQSDNPAEFSIRTVKESADHCFMNTNDEASFFADFEKVLSLSK